MGKIDTLTFPNGLRIVYEKSNNKLPISTVYLFCELGSLYENEDIRGVSHFIEHMCFKGTKKFLKSENILKAFDKSGSIFNASTFKNYTYYYIQCISQYLFDYLVVFSDILLNSTFDGKNMDKEMKIIMEENIKDDDDKEFILQNGIEQLIYQGSPLENPVDSILYHKQKYDYQKIVDIYKLFYQPNNMVLSIVSNISFQTILTKLRRTHFYTRKNNHSELLSNLKLVVYKPPADQKNIVYKIQKIKNTNATYVSIAFRTCSQHSHDKYILNVLQYILGELYNSRLSDLLREENGLIYTSNVDTQYFEVIGDFTLMAITDPDKLIKINGSQKPGVIPLIIGLLRELLKNGITEEELTQAKQFMKGRMVLDLSEQDTNAIYNGDRVLFYSSKQIIPYDKLFDTYYKDIQIEHLNQVIHRYFKKENMCFCIVGEIGVSEKRIREECAKLFLV